MKNFSIASLALVAISAVAHAAGAPAVTVKFGDLDLNGEKGAAALYQRIEHAAQFVCEQMVDSRNLAMKSRTYACINKTISDTVAKVDRTALSAYAAKTQPSVITLASR